MELRESTIISRYEGTWPLHRLKVRRRNLDFYRVKGSLRGVITHSTEHLLNHFLREATEVKRFGPSLEPCGTPITNPGI